MAQYFEVLSQRDGIVEQGTQFFNGNQENEPTQVRYILADDSRQFQGQQVMVVDGSQQQVQGVVIDQGQIAYQQSSQPQQYSAVVPNTSINSQQTQQIYYMETSSSPGGENVQTVIEQSSPIQQNTQGSTQPQPIVLNHQIGTTAPNMSGNRHLPQGAPAQRPVLHIRTPVRQGHVQVNTPARTVPTSTPMRQGLPQQIRSQQVSLQHLRGMTGPQAQMRLRAPSPQQSRQPGQQPTPRPLVNTQPRSQVLMVNRQLGALQKQQQPPQSVAQQAAQQQQSQPVIQQSPAGALLNASHTQKGLNEFQRQQQMNNDHHENVNPDRQTITIGKQIRKPLSDFRPLLEKDNEVPQASSTDQVISIGKQISKPLSDFHHLSENDDVEELDDQDPSMNTTSNPLANYKRFLEQRQQIGKNPILARLPSNIKITPTTSNQQPQPYSVAQKTDEAVHQAQQQAQQQQAQQQVPSSVQQHAAAQQQAPVQQQPQVQQQQQLVSEQQQQQQSVLGVQPPQANVNQNAHAAQTLPGPQKRPRAPPRPKNPNPNPRIPSVGRQRVPRLPNSAQGFGPTRMIGPQLPPQQGPRFPINQQQPPRFPNQQQMMQPRMALHPQAAHQPQSQQQAQPPIAQPAQPNAQLNQAPLAQQQQNGGNQSQINYLITPPTPNRPRQQRPLPSYIPSSQIQQIIGMFKESTPIAEEFSDSIRMLVLLENGEQRLITFTLPKEACTIQEILEQVNVPFTPETNIQVTEANTNGINYIVTVGNVSNIAYTSNEEEPQEAGSPESHQVVPTAPPNRQLPPQENNIQSPYAPPQATPGLPPEPPKVPSPELPKEVPPKLIPGKLAVCLACGYTGEDFNRCTRCLRKLPDNVRSIDSPIKVDIHKPLSAELSKLLPNHGQPIFSSTPMKPGNPLKPESGNGKSPSPTKKKTSKSKQVEHESVVISSDEEEDEKKPVKSVRVSEQLLKSLGASISISPITKEPSLTEIMKHVRKLSVEAPEFIQTSLMCRTVRIGSYRFVPAGEVTVDSKCLLIKAPVIDNKKEIKTVRIDRGDIVKVLVCFNKALPVIFYYLNVGAAPVIREMLNMKKETGLYYDPVDDKEDSYRKITLLPEDFGEEHKSIFNQLYGLIPYNIMDELTSKEANDILIKTCPKDTTAANFGSFSEIKQILLYPKEGQGRLSINTEDYACLAVDQFLNDKIIDFYLKYLWENLHPEKQKKVHIFSTFFYKRLTTKPAKAAKKSHPFESDSSLSAAEKRHCRVKSWTKRLNLFEKDYIVVPINENAHWFLAIICFPGLRGPQTFDGKPYKPEPKPVKSAKKKISKEDKKEKPIPCDDPMLSDKDEAESEDSDMESDDSEEAAAAAAAAAEVAAAAAAPLPVPPPKRKAGERIPIKQPCILIFDSLAGPSRSRVVATLRDYLTMEYKSKMDTERIYNRDVIKGANCKVPQQNNFTDCGLYLLQYVEQFFTDPIQDFNIPIKGIQDWFEEITVTRKREDICNLIKELMEEAGADPKMLPEIALPTVNGKLIERQEGDHEHDVAEDEQEDMFTDIEDSEMTDGMSNNKTMSDKTSEENEDSKLEDGQENLSSGENSSPGSLTSSPIKPSVEGISDRTDMIASVTHPVLKPTLSEFSAPRQTSNKDTLNYLKSKRINRHKAPSEGPEYKKTKFES